MFRMKQKQLEGVLGNLSTFQKPKVLLEQYQTSAEIASSVLCTIHMTFDDVKGKMVCDLGCGCGTFVVGACLLGADFCVGFDIDEEALAICQENISDLELENSVDLLNMDITRVSDNMRHMFDTVIMNPPFGTKLNEGIDVKFLKAASYITTGSIYSMHKSSTRKHIIKVATDLNLKTEILAHLRFDLPKTMKFHTKNTHDIEVDFIRFSRINKC